MKSNIVPVHENNLIKWIYHYFILLAFPFHELELKFQSLSLSLSLLIFNV